MKSNHRFRFLRHGRGLFAALLATLLLAGCSEQKALDGVFFQSQLTWFSLGEKGPVPLRSVQEFPHPVWKFWTKAVRPSGLLASVTQGRPVVYAAISNAGVWEFNEGSSSLNYVPVGEAGNLAGYHLGAPFTARSGIFVTLSQQPLQEGLPAVALAYFDPLLRKLQMLPVPSQVADPLKQLVKVVQGPAETLQLTWKKNTADEVSFSQSVFDLADGSEGDVQTDLSLALVTEDRAALLARAGDLAPLIGAAEEFYKTGLKIHTPLGASESVVILREGGSAVDLAWTRSANRLILLASDGHLFVKKLTEGAPLQPFTLPALGTYGRYTAVAALPQGFLFAWELSRGPFTGPSGLLYLPSRLLD